MPYPFDKDTNATLQKCREGEPIFVLRAQDQTAPHAVREWANRAADLGVSREKIMDALDVAGAMDAWQREHAAKLPD